MAESQADMNSYITTSFDFAKFVHNCSLPKPSLIK